MSKVLMPEGSLGLERSRREIRDRDPIVTSAEQLLRQHLWAASTRGFGVAPAAHKEIFWGKGRGKSHVLRA